MLTTQSKERFGLELESKERGKLGTGGLVLGQKRMSQVG